MEFIINYIYSDNDSEMGNEGKGYTVVNKIRRFFDSDYLQFSKETGDGHCQCYSFTSGLIRKNILPIPIHEQGYQPLNKLKSIRETWHGLLDAGEYKTYVVKWRMYIAKYMEENKHDLLKNLDITEEVFNACLRRLRSVSAANSAAWTGDSLALIVAYIYNVKVMCLCASNDWKNTEKMIVDGQERYAQTLINESANNAKRRVFKNYEDYIWLLQSPGHYDSLIPINKGDYVVKSMRRSGEQRELPKNIRVHVLDDD